MQCIVTNQEIVIRKILLFHNVHFYASELLSALHFPFLLAKLFSILPWTTDFLAHPTRIERSCSSCFCLSVCPSLPLSFFLSPSQTDHHVIYRFEKDNRIKRGEMLHYHYQQKHLIGRKGALIVWGTWCLWDTKYHGSFQSHLPDPQLLIGFSPKMFNSLRLFPESKLWKGCELDYHSEEFNIYSMS